MSRRELVSNQFQAARRCDMSIAVEVILRREAVHKEDLLRVVLVGNGGRDPQGQAHKG